MDIRPVIDADSHVEEGEQVWGYLDEPFRHRRPAVVNMQGLPGLPAQDAFWLIDGRTFPKPRGHGATITGTPVTSTFARSKPFSIASQTLADPAARLADMDRFGVDVQVLFPTVFLEPLTEDLEFEVALMRSYNTWLGGVCAGRPDRLKWAAIMPMRSVPAAVAELRRARELGACCAAIYGTAGERLLHERAFDPFWAEAVRLKMPIAVHVGWSHPGLTRSCDRIYAAQIISFTMTVFMGFFSIIGGGVLDRFPELKVGFFEAGADWLPYMVQRMDQYYAADSMAKWEILPERPCSQYLRDGSIYFTCEGDERLLPIVLEYLGEDHMMASADMPHTEARENTLNEIKARTDITATQKEKILSKNAVRFFGL